MLPKGLITGKTSRLPGDYQPQAEPAKSLRRSQKSGEMNKTEAAYAWELSLLTVAGDIRRWWFEPFKLILAPRVTYRVDFLIEHNDGSLECVEIKGHIEDDAAAKFRMAREKFPCFTFTMLKRHGGEWEEVLK